MTRDDDTTMTPTTCRDFIIAYAERLKQVAQLFNLTPAQYAKACLYRDLGCFLEPLDRRKTRHKRRSRVLTWERPDEEVER